MKNSIENNQFGFRSRNGTREALLVLRILLERQLDLNRNYMLFVNTEKTFDIVHFKRLFKITDGISIDYKNRHVIFQLYKI